MDEEKLEDFKSTMDAAFYATTKALAKPHIQRLQFLADQLGRDEDEYFRGKLKEVVGAVETGSGRVKNKPHWKGVASSSWFAFENHVRNREILENKKT